MALIPDHNYNSEQAKRNVQNNIAKKSCLACDNFRACHPRTSLCYCTDGSKSVFFDAGCESWRLDPKLKSTKFDKEGK